MARNPWWRPRSTFGRILLATATFLGLAGLGTLAFLVRQFLVSDRHFRIPGAANVESSGLSEVKRAELLPVFGEDIGRNIFFVPLSERRRQLESIPWVQRATIMRFLPDRLSVSIVERTPVAFVREGERVELADADGVLLSMPPAMMAQHHYSFPVVTGINAKDPPAARRARMAVYQRFVTELDQNNQHWTEQVSEIDVSDLEDLRATMPEQGSDILAHFGEDQFLHRLQIYKAHIAEWRQRYPQLIGVDLRYNGEVPLEIATDPSGSGVGADSGRIPALSAVTVTGGKPAAPSAAPAAAQDTAKSPANAIRQLDPAAASGAALTAPTAKTPPNKIHTSARKAAEAKKRAAMLRAAKAKAARQNAAHNEPRPFPAAFRQGQPTTCSLFPDSCSLNL